MKKRNLAVRDNLLRRGRIDALLEQGLEYPLVTVVAAPGYGKTQAVAAFAQTMGRRLAWVYFSAMEDSVPRFWEKFCDAINEEMPELAQALREIEFPGTPVQFEAFLRVFTKALYTGEQVVIVLDDYHKVQIPGIRQFFDGLSTAGLENFCLIILSNERQNLNVNTLKQVGSVFSITMEDLRFTVEEATQWFSLHGILLPEKRMKELVAETGGWPLAFFLLVAKNTETPVALNTETILPLTAELFEVEYYNGYTPAIQQLLVKLSLLGDFTLDIVRDLDAADLDEAVQTMSLHMFITYDHATGFFTFHKMYQEFLAQKSYLLSGAQRDEVYLTAGNRFFEVGKYYNAVYCFRACRCYERMFQVLEALNGRRKSRTMAEYILECLLEIPQEMQEKNPIIEFYIGLLYMNNAQLDRTMSIMNGLENRLVEKGDMRTEDEDSLLGEVYAVLGDISIICHKPDFVLLFEKAAKLLPAGSRVRRPQLMFVANHSVLFLSDNGPGALDKMLTLINKAVPYIEAISNGSGYGYELLFAAEASYATFDLDNAKQQCFRAIYKAGEYDQHDIICNAYFLLMRIAYVEGEMENTQTYLDTICTHVNTCGLSDLYELGDCAISWLALRLGRIEDLPHWVTAPNSPSRTQLTSGSGRIQFLYASYLACSGRFHESLAILSSIEQMYAQEGLWYLKLSAYVERVRCHLCCDEPRLAMDAFYHACEMTRHNHIIMPFVEFAPELKEIIGYARVSSHPFDSGWLDTLEYYAGVFVDHNKTVAGQGGNREKNQPEVRTNPLTPTGRELEVLNYLANGYTRDEIAVALGISVNGVKKHITNIYNKLGAINRADAIHIAIAKGYIK